MTTACVTKRSPDFALVEDFQKTSDNKLSLAMYQKYSRLIHKVAKHAKCEREEFFVDAYEDVHLAMQNAKLSKIKSPETWSIHAYLLNFLKKHLYTVNGFSSDSWLLTKISYDESSYSVDGEAQQSMAEKMFSKMSEPENLQRYSPETCYVQMESFLLYRTFMTSLSFFEKSIVVLRAQNYTVRMVVDELNRFNPPKMVSFSSVQRTLLNLKQRAQAMAGVTLN